MNRLVYVLTNTVTSPPREGEPSGAVKQGERKEGEQEESEGEDEEEGVEEKVREKEEGYTKPLGDIVL